MSVLERLSGEWHANDEAANIALAEELAARSDPVAVAELAAALSRAPQALRSDALKVLYELGERRPELIAPHAEAFFAVIGGRNNRMIWGGLAALAAIANVEPARIADRLPAILEAADRSTVIAKDKTMRLLARLTQAGFRARALPELLERLQQSPLNQFAMYAELALPAVDASHRARFRTILEQQLKADMPLSKRRRIEQVLRGLA